MPLDYPIDTRTLDNGLRVTVSSDTTTPIVAVNLWYDVGSRHEPEGLTGFAHLFEHLMFQGSRNVPEGRYFAWLEQVGASLNASTFFDRTNYFESLPSGGLELALWMEADRMAYLLDALDQANLDNQREVVKEEKRQRYDNQPYGDQFERLVSLGFPQGHPYHHMTIGSMADIDAASLTDVRSFFAEHYGPNNAVLSIVGDVTPDRGHELAQKYFGHIPAIPQPKPAPDGAIGPIDGVRTDDVHDDVPSDLVTMFFRLPVDGGQDIDAATLALDVLAAGQSSRLNRDLVRRSEIAQGVSGGALPLIGGVSFGTLTGIASEGTDLGKVEDALAEQVERLATDGVTDEELATVQAQAERDWLETLAGVAGRADEISHAHCLFDDPDRVNRRIDDLRAITADDVQRVASEWIRFDKRVQVRYHRAERADGGPTDEQADTNEEVA